MIFLICSDINPAENDQAGNISGTCVIIIAKDICLIKRIFFLFNQEKYTNLYFRDISFFRTAQLGRPFLAYF